MKSCLEALSVCVLFVCLERTKGQCQNVDSRRLITSCEEHKTGDFVFVDFQKINRSCTCIVESFFTGDLLVYVSLATRLYSCTEEVVVSYRENKVIFKCNASTPKASTFSVRANDTPVVVKVDYKAGFSTEKFYPCLQLKENLNSDREGGTVSVTCGNLTTDTTTTKSTTPTTTTASRTSTTSTAATISPSKQETTSYNTTTVVYPSPQKSTYVSPDNMTYIIAGAATGVLVLVVIVIALVAIIVLRKKKGRKNDKIQKTDEASEHTNRAFDENYALPDNPLYHSAQPMDEVGYSSVQNNQLGLPPTEATNTKENDPNYDVPTNNRPINDSDTSPMPIYAVPNKARSSGHDENEPQAMYAQVSKPSKGTTQVPMQSANQDGLVFLEVEKNPISVNENSPYTRNESKDGVSYAEIKRN